MYPEIPMGKRRRTRPGPPPQISEAHFRLLREYGRNDLPNRISPREQKRLWEMMCQSAGLPIVERERVVEAWKTYIGGQSEHSNIAINGDIDPRFTTLGITYLGKLTAAHTTKTPALLKRVLKIFAKSFSSRAEFLDAAERMCRSVANAVFPTEGPS
jgi:hypothetical protein